MNLYHISQDAVSGYDTYSDAVVAAESEQDAKNIHPDGARTLKEKADEDWYMQDWTTKTENVKCDFLTSK